MQLNKRNVIGKKAWKVQFVQAPSRECSDRLLKMKILVLVRDAPDDQEAVSLDFETGQPDLANHPKMINPFDEIAVEAAVQWVEKGWAHHVTVLAFADEQNNSREQDILQRAMAMGSSEAKLVLLPDTIVSAGNMSENKVIPACIARYVQKETYDLIICGKQSIANDDVQKAARIAGILNWSQAMAVSAVYMKDQYVVAACETDTGTELKQLALPCVISADIALAEPRFVRLPQLLKARKKEISVLLAAQLFSDTQVNTFEADFQVKSWSLLPESPDTCSVNSVSELMAKLENDRQASGV